MIILLYNGYTVVTGREKTGSRIQESFEWYKTERKPILVLPPIFKYLSSKEHFAMTKYSFSFLTDYFLFFAANRRYNWKSKVSAICQHIELGFTCAISSISLVVLSTLITTDFWLTGIVMGVIFMWTWHQPLRQRLAKAKLCTLTAARLYSLPPCNIPTAQCITGNINSRIQTNRSSVTENICRALPRVGLYEGEIAFVADL